MKTPANTLSAGGPDWIGSSGRPRFRAGELFTVAFLLVLSLVVIHHRAILSGFAIIDGGGDSVLSNIALEHEWRWVSGDPVHRDLWSPPNFFPERETAAYTDLLLGVSPLYDIWRVWGASIQTAFQLWMLTISVLNYAGAYLLLRLLVRVSVPAGAIGAFLFAFGSPRIMQIGHQQLLPGFYVVAAFAGLYILLSETPADLTPRRAVTGLMLFAGGVVAQLYTAFYYAWFMAFCVAVALFIALLVPALRNRLVSFVRIFWRPVCLSILLAIVLLAPAAMLYEHALKTVGPRQYSEVQHFLPTLEAWFAQGPQHWIYGQLNRKMGIDQSFGGEEMFNGIGPVTTGLVLMGFILFRRRRAMLIWGAVCGVAVAAVLVWPGGFSLWRFVYDYFPGAQAVRAVSRFGVFLLLPASMSLALSVDWIARRIHPLAAVLCMLVVFVEQAGSSTGTRSYSQVSVEGPAEGIAHQLRPECRTFLVSFPANQTSVPWMQIYGMWASLLSEVPTLNGYSGQVPPHWPLGDVSVGGPADRSRLYGEIQEWMHQHAREIPNVCWVLSDGTGTTMIQNPEAPRDDLPAR